MEKRPPCTVTSGQHTWARRRDGRVCADCGYREYGSFDEIRKVMPMARAAFEMQVEAVALEVTAIAKQISSALGEVSIDELKQAIIREFTERISEPIIFEGKQP